MNEDYDFYKKQFYLEAKELLDNVNDDIIQAEEAQDKKEQAEEQYARRLEEVSNKLKDKVIEESELKQRMKK